MTDERAEIIRQMAELHKPTRKSSYPNGSWDCEECNDHYGYWSTDWPCSTIEVLLGEAQTKSLTLFLETGVDPLSALDVAIANEQSKTMS